MFLENYQIKTCQLLVFDRIFLLRKIYKLRDLESAVLDFRSTELMLKLTSMPRRETGLLYTVFNRVNPGLETQGDLRF
jgi:hypothetical protein